MKLPSFRKYKRLFTTQSGIVVKKEIPLLPRHHLLVRYNRTGLILLNNRRITDTVYRSLLHNIQYYHPDAFVRAEAHQTIIIYPKLVVE